MVQEVYVNILSFVEKYSLHLAWLCLLLIYKKVRDERTWKRQGASETGSTHKSHDPFRLPSTIKSAQNLHQE